MNMFKKLCKQNQQRKFDFLRNILNGFTQKQVKERKAAEKIAIAAQLAGTLTATVAEPVGLCDLPAIDPPWYEAKERKKHKELRTVDRERASCEVVLAA